MVILPHTYSRVCKFSLHPIHRERKALESNNHSHTLPLSPVTSLTTCILSSPPYPATSLIDAYSPTSVLSSPATVPLGTTVVLVCRVGGVASGTQLSYTWTCPNGPCDVGEGNNPNRKTYGDRMVLNVLTSRDGGTYTCLVREGQDAVHGPSFTLNVQGEWYTINVEYVQL